MAAKSTWKRAFVKSAAWKLVSIIVLVIISWMAGLGVVQIGKITVAYHVVTLFLYVINERAWSNTSWGKVPLEDTG